VRLLALDLGASLRGGQKQTALLLAELAGRGHAIRFIGRRAAPLAECLRNRGIDVVEAPPGPEASPGLLLAVARAARLFQPDLLYAGDSRGHGAAVWSRASAARPLVVHRRVAFRPSGHPLSRVKYRAADRFLAVSGAVAASLAEAGVDPSRIAVVPDGLPPEAFVSARLRDATNPSQPIGTTRAPASRVKNEEVQFARPDAVRLRPPSPRRRPGLPSRRGRK